MILTVIDTVCMVILVVPAKSGEEHADVDPRYGHPTDVRLDVAQKAAVNMDY